MKRLTSVILAFALLMSCVPSGIFSLPAFASEEPQSLVPVEDTWTGGATSYRENIQGVFEEGSDSNDYTRLQAMGKSADGDLSTKTYNSAITYMKFDMSEYSDEKITSAKLKLWGKSNVSAVSGVKMYFFKTGNDWSESTLYYQNAPVLPLRNGLPAVDLIGSEDPERIKPDFVSASLSFPSSEEENELIEIDVTELLKKYNLTKDSTVSFAYMIYASSYTLCAVSKDHEDESLHPSLEIETESVPDFKAISGPEGEIDFQSSVSVEFNNSINGETANSSTVFLYEDGEEAEISDEDITVNETTLTLNTPKQGYCTYELVISGLEDIYGNALSEDASYTFKTVGANTEVTYNDIFDSANLPTKSPDQTRLTDSSIVYMYGGGGAYYVYYVEMDLSSVDISTPISQFTYYAKLRSGNAAYAVTVYEIDEDFEPETVTYNTAPSLGNAIDSVKVGEIMEEYVGFDITDYVNSKIPSLGEDKIIRFALKSNGATSRFYTDFASETNRPKASISYDDDTFVGVKSTCPVHGETNADPDGEIIVEFSVQMEKVSNQNFKLTNLSSGEEILLSQDNVVYDEALKTATITPPSPLSELCAYELVASGISLDGETIKPKKIKFVTASRIESGDIEIITDENKAAATVDISNLSSLDTPCPTLALAIYEGRKCVAFDFADDGDVLLPGESKTLSLSLDIISDSAYVKAFLWNNTDEQKPLKDCVISGNSSFESKGKYFGIRTIEGGFSKTENAFVSLIVSDEEGNIVYIDQTTSDGDGKFTFDLSFDKSGDYTATVMSSGYFGTKAEFLVSGYTSYEDYIDVWEKLNSKSVSDIEQALEKAIDIFDFDKIDYDISEVISDVANDIRDNQSYGEYSEENIAKLYGVLEESAYRHFNVKALLTSITDAKSHSNLTEIFTDEENAELLGISSYLADYNKNKTKVNKALVGKKFKDLEDFKDKFKKALKKDNEGGSSSSSSTGGGGSTVYMGAPAPAVDLKPADTPAAESVPTQKSDTIIQTEENYFVDSSSVPWAEKEIEFLYRMGVINGRGERTYAPNDNVLREEFVKLILETCELKPSGETSDFEDVPQNSWFYPYVSLANTKEIVSGISDTHFGSGTPITRQDICVMIQRALSSMGYATATTKEVSFSDSAAVSDYAVDAVRYLSEYGIITGTPDGRFNPKANATRAEVALIIYRTLGHIKDYASTIWKEEEPAEDTVGENGKFIYSTPTVEQIKADIENILMNKSHPYLHGDRQKLESIKQSLANGDDEYIKKEYEQTKAVADNLVATPSTKTYTTVSQGLSSVRPNVLSLMTVYFVEGDEKYLKRALSEFETMTGITDWYDGAQLDTTMTEEALATCYDWLYDYLTPEQRKWVETSIKDKCLIPSYEYYLNPAAHETIRNKYERINLQVGYSSFNHAVYNNSHNIIAALAIAKTDPDYCAVIIANALKNLECYWELTKDGGFEEPTTYYEYCTGQAVMAMSAVYSALDTLYGYEKCPGFKNTAWFGLYMWGPMVIGDTSSANKSEGYSTDKLYFFAKMTKNAQMMKRIVDLDRSNPVYTLLWYDKGEHNNLGNSVQIPLDRLFAVPDQYTAVLRDHGDDKYNIFTGLYAGCGNATGHSDPVSGLFCLDAFGERYITALGAGDYDLDGYWDNHQSGRRWNYYERRTEAGNCLVINPSLDPGQDVTATATISEYETSDGCAYAIADLQPVYYRETESYKRGLKFHNNRTQIVVQDEAVMKKESEIFWSFNTPANIEIIDESTAMLSIGDKKVAIKVYANVPYEMYIMNAEKLPTSPVVDTQRAYKEYKKLAIKATGVKELKLMVEFTPIVSEHQMPKSISPWIDLDNWTAKEPGADKPRLSSISINGIALSDFDPDNFFYTIDTENFGENINVNATAEGDYSCDIIYPEKLPGAIDIEVGDEEGNVSYYRVRVMGKAETIDVSKFTKLKIQKVTADDNDGNLPENVADGNMETRWSAEGRNGDVNLNLDLGSEQELKAIGIAFHSGTARKTYFELYTSTDGKTWTKQIESGRSSGETNDFENFALDTKARYIRYVGQQNSTNHWNSVTEIAVYGK